MDNVFGGVSNNTFDYQIFNFITHNFNRHTRILDVGCGSGKYGKILRKSYDIIDGAEVFLEYIKKFELNKIYNNIYNTKIEDFDFDKNKYDLIIFGDVLEHIKESEAKKLLKKIIDLDLSVIVRVPYLYKQEKIGENIYEKHEQDNLTREVMEELYPYLQCLIGNKDFGVWYYLSKNHKIKAQTVIFTHIQDLNKVIFHKNWHKKILSNVACVRNILNFNFIEASEETIDIKINNPKIIPDKFMSSAIEIFEKTTNPFYYILLEWDAVIIDPEFETKCIEYMEKNSVDAMFSQLRNKFIDEPNTNFVNMLPNMPAKAWSNTNCVIINRNAMEFYIKKSFRDYPIFWCEVRWPTVLTQEGFSVIQNPFIYRNTCSHFGDGELTESLILEGIRHGTSVLHPIKSQEKFDFIKSILDKKEKKD